MSDGRDPVVGEPVEIRAAALPRARGRHAHEVDPEPDPARGGLAEQRVDLLAPQRRAAGQRRAQPLRGGLHLGAGSAPCAWPAATTPAALRGSRPRAASSPRRRRGGWCCASASPGSRSRASSARVSASRSKPSSRDHRPMYIDGAYCACRPAHPLEHPRDRHAGTLQQALAGEQRAIELARVERTRSVQAAWAVGAPGRLPASSRATSSSSRSSSRPWRDGVELAGAELDEAAGPPGRARASRAGRPRPSRGGG